MNGLELNAKVKTPSMILIVVLYAIGAVSVPYQYVAGWLGGSLATEHLCGFISKSACAVLPFYLVREFGMTGMFRFDRYSFKGLILCIPALAVVLGNFPFIPIMSGDMSINADTAQIICYVLYCVSIGVLEESMFRGNVFPLLLYAFGRNKKGTFFAVVVSSAIFGAMHLLNLLGGFSPAVFLQVGYSFLIGCMCALALLWTGNIFVPIILHSLFDIGGFLYDTFGTGTLWTGANIAFYAVVSVVCAAIIVVVFFKKDVSGVYDRLGLNVYPTDEERARLDKKN